MTAVLFDYWRSSASYRVRIALHLAEITFDRVPVDLRAGEQTSPEHLSRNPQGFVPVLEIDGLRLTQSLAILEYLNESRHLGLLPPTASDAAHVRALAYSLAVDVHPVCNLSVVKRALGAAQSDPMIAQEWMSHFIRRGLETFETLLNQREPTRYSHGDTLSLADLCLVPQLYNARRWHVNFDDLPHIRDVEAVCIKHPSIRAAHPEMYRP
ncbi:maleylacetoacetate isomerase [Shimia sp. NS0008-38b]|uniref:maleylacetoacetate isomerase n=1 Tax=Shimia sp. NS0008-38b TaxID=3127653 RepID=UPI003101E4FA